MKRIVLAYNPVSGNASFKSKLDGIVEAFQRRNILLCPYRTRKDGNEDLMGLLKEFRAEGLIAAGGDGTLHEAANLLMKSGLDIPLGMLGCGTSNDFATYLKINDDWEKYFDCIAEGRTRRVDLGRVDGEYFINVASAGMMTGIAHEVDARWKNAMGKMAYYLRGIGELPKFRSIRLQIETDERHHAVEAFLFVVINSSVVGSLRHVADGVEVDDGKLDFLAVRKCSPAQLVKVAADLIAGKPVSEQSAVLHLQSAHFRITAEEELVSDLDGEAGPLLPLEIETVPQALAVYC